MTVTTPGQQLPYLGTLRCEAGRHGFLASGDLYIDRSLPSQAALGVPIFPIRDYRYYLRVEKLVLQEQGKELRVAMTSFTYLRGSWVGAR